jgi:peptidyl-prolyl cis-trans isomerase-like protein 2
VTGEKLDVGTLTTLKFDKNESGEYVDPVTKKTFTDFSKLVAIKTSGRVYLWDTVEQLNLKAKSLRDLVSDEEFTRADLIILQDPMDLDKQNISTFKNLQDAEEPSPAEGTRRFSIFPDGRQNLKSKGSCSQIESQG